MTQIYTVTFTHINGGGEHISRIFQTIKAARAWKRYLECKPYAIKVTLYCGQPGGEIVSPSATPARSDYPHQF